MSSKQMTVLLVDRNALDVELMRSVFESPNSTFTLRSVPDGGEAIKYIAGQGEYADRQRFPEPMVVLLDLSLPAGEGLGMLRWMHQQPMVRMPPVIALS